jgi:hypothetical protein
MKSTIAISVLSLVLAALLSACSAGGFSKGQGSYIEDSAHHESGHPGHRGGHAGHRGGTARW